MLEISIAEQRRERLQQAASERGEISLSKARGLEIGE